VIALDRVSGPPAGPVVDHAPGQSLRLSAVLLDDGTRVL
jgi:hypothetical protein